MDSDPQNSVGGQPDAAVLAESLRRVIGVFVRAIRGDADTPGSSRNETLALLSDRGAMSIAALAHLRHVKHQSMRLVLDQLVQNELVTMTSAAADRRSKSVTITDAGREALSRDRSIRTKLIEGRIRDVLTHQDRDVLAAAVPLLERLCYASTPGADANRLS